MENERLEHTKLAHEREQQELKLAREIQLRLLPTRGPEVAGLELAAAYVPATEVGGDYYDYLQLSDGGLGLVIADVAGKGVPAGLVMTAVRSVFRTACRGTPHPASLLQQVNDQLCQESLSGFFVTAVCVRIDVARGRLTLATAGHEPLLLLQRGQVALAGKERRQPALGLVPDLVFEQESHTFEPGDAFVLYTDGVSEAMNEFRNQFGVRRLREVLSRCQDTCAAAALDAITSAVDDYIGKARRHDDVTLLVGGRAPA